MQTINFLNSRTIHFIGIKGVGMTPLAIIAKEAGFSVTGSDVDEIFITDASLKKAGIISYADFSPHHVNHADLVITTGAHGGFDNVEVKAAKAKGIPVVTQGEAIARYIDGSIFNCTYKGISITGCHGKTTTSAMVATIFRESGLDPSYVVGTSDILPIGLPGHFGKGKYFIAEADEYSNEPVYDKTPKFLLPQTSIGVITNIEHDHPDLYPTLDDVVSAYEQFALQVKDIVIINSDDDNNKHIIHSLKKQKKTNKRIITFGFNHADYQIENWHIVGENIIFSLKHIGEFTLSVYGEHNMMNATAAIIVAKEAGVLLPDIIRSLALFQGTKRRTEFIGALPTGALLYDDYGHHPTEIAATLYSLQERYPEKKIVCIFQPHTYSRTRLLFEEFSNSFEAADEIILTNIFPSARESVDPSVSSELLAEAVGKFKKHVLFLPGLSDVVEYVKRQKFGKDYIVVTMGAGDVYKVGENLHNAKIKDQKSK